MTGWQDSFQPVAAPPSSGWQSSFQPSDAQSQQSDSMGALADMLKSGGAQAAKDVAQVPMWVGDTANAATQGVSRLAGEAKEGLADLGVGQHLTIDQAKELTNPTLPFYGSDQVINAAQPAIKEATGADINYQPQTPEGKYTASIVGALPYALNPEMGAAQAIGMGVGQQGGKDIASQFTDDPRYQQVAGIAGGMGGMTAAKPVVAGAKAIAANDIGTNLSGILGDNSSGGSPATPQASASLPTYDPAQIKEAAQAAYANSEKIGGQVPIDNMRQAVNGMLNNKDIGQQTARGQAFSGDNPVTQTMTKLQDAVKSDDPWTTADANEIDDSLRNDITKARSAGDYDSARRLGIIKNSLRDTYQSYAQSNPQQAAGFNEWIRGDKLYSAAMNGQEVSDIIDNAQRADVPSTAIKNGFKSFVKNDDNRIGLTDDEWGAAQYAAKHGMITQGLKNVGSRLAGHIGGIVGGASVAGPLGAVAGDIAGQAVTAPFRAWANARQAARGQNVIDLISQRPAVQEALSPGFKLPTAEPTPQSQAPLALPAPVPREAALVPDGNGALRQQTPQEYWNGVLAQRKANATGNTSDVAKVQAQNAAIAVKNAKDDFLARQMAAQKAAQPLALPAPQEGSGFIGNDQGVRPRTESEAFAASPEATRQAQLVYDAQAARLKKDGYADNQVAARLGNRPEVAQAAPTNALEQFQQMVAAKNQPVIEKTPAGEQAVIPGAEKISDKALAERNMQKPLQATVPQNKDIGGIFDTDAHKQTDLMDTLKNEPPAIEKKAPEPILYKKPNEKGVLPTSFKTFIMQPMIGGIKDFGGEVKEVAPALVAKGDRGLSIDDALTRAKEHGYMPEDATQADFLTKLGETDNGKGLTRLKDEGRVEALRQSRSAKQQNDPALIERDAANMGIDTAGKSANDLLDEMSARKSHEDSLRDYVSQYQAHQDEMAAQEKAHQKWLQTRGEAWEPTPEPKIRSLEDLENEYEQEKASGGMVTREQPPQAALPTSGNQGGIPESEGSRGSGAGDTEKAGNGTVNPLLEFIKNEKGSISPKVYEELLNQIQKNAPALTISRNAVQTNTPQNDKQPLQATIKTEPLSYNAKEPVNTSMRDQLMGAFAKAESNNNPNAKNPNSSASGLMQFTDGTWRQMVKRYGAETGISLQDKGDPKAQKVMAQLYAKDNINRMQPFLKRMPTRGELYIGHFLGADGALRLINAANTQPDKQAIMLFPKAVTSANHSIFFNGDRPKTALQVYQHLASKV